MRELLFILNLLFIPQVLASSNHHDHKHEHQHSQEKTSLGAHVHGELNCSIAVDEKEVYLELHSPADSLLGFEHKPQSDAELKKWQELKSSWEKTLFNSFEVKGLECLIQAPQIHLNVDENASHAQISAMAQLMCPQKLDQAQLKISLREKFEKIEKLSIDILPAQSAPYKKNLKGDKKIIELKL